MPRCTHTGEHSHLEPVCPATDAPVTMSFGLDSLDGMGRLRPPVSALALNLPSARAMQRTPAKIQTTSSGGSDGTLQRKSRHDTSFRHAYRNADTGLSGTDDFGGAYMSLVVELHFAHRRRALLGQSGAGAEMQNLRSMVSPPTVLSKPPYALPRPPSHRAGPRSTFQGLTPRARDAPSWAQGAQCV
jgi:hypothetical protein